MRLFVKYPQELLGEPILSSLVLEFGTKLNVLTAQVDGRTGEMVIEVDDSRAEDIIGYLKKKGVSVSKVFKKIDLDDKKCIDCGACVSICPVGALYMEDFSVELDQSKCVLCKNCIDACPVKALSLK